MKRAVTNLKASSGSETTFFCLSNANAVFIPTILKVRESTNEISFDEQQLILSSSQSKGLDTLFEKIVTNPAEWDPSGLLRVRRRVDPNGPQHKCSVGCSPNMCKGMPKQYRLNVNHSLLPRGGTRGFLGQPCDQVRPRRICRRRFQRFLSDRAATKVRRLSYLRYRY